MAFESIDGRKDCENNAVDFVGISEIFVMYDAVFLETEPFYGV